jgi:hypothetical protein
MNQRRATIRPGFSLFLFTLVSLHSGCNFTTEYVLEKRTQNVRDDILILPEGRQNRPCIKDFIAFKETQHFRTEIKSFSTKANMAKRYEDLQKFLSQRLQRCFHSNTCYALIIASPSELTMGPWTFEGVTRPIRSDTPYFLNKVFSKKGPVAAEHWEKILEPSFPWARSFD